MTENQNDNRNQQAGRKSNPSTTWSVQKETTPVKKDGKEVIVAEEEQDEKEITTDGDSKAE